MAKIELGTKRVCPETGRKFYDLNRDPIVSPYSGKSYPISYFDEVATSSVISREIKQEVGTEARAQEVDELDDETDDVEIVSLEEADDDMSKSTKEKSTPAIDGSDEDDVDVDLDDDDDAFLAVDDDDDDDDVSDIIGVNDDDDE